MPLPITPIALHHADSFRACLDAVARERRYLAQLEAPPPEQVRSFIADNIAADAVQFVALDGDTVVGWADVLRRWAHAAAHCGVLGMGVLPAYRGQGLGQRLLAACIDKARLKGITRIELEVRADNARAIALYERMGFVLEGRKRAAMRFDGEYFDALLMSRVEPEAPPGTAQDP